MGTTGITFGELKPGDQIECTRCGHVVAVPSSYYRESLEILVVITCKKCLRRGMKLVPRKVENLPENFVTC